MIIAPVRVL